MPLQRSIPGSSTCLASIMAGSLVALTVVTAGPAAAVDESAFMLKSSGDLAGSAARSQATLSTLQPCTWSWR